MSSQRLALGTVQFGIAYGATNQCGKVPLGEVAEILRLAHSSGLRILDSASTYGDAQAVIGKTLAEENLTDDFSVVTKVHLTSSHDLPGQLRAQIESTLAELRGVPLHSLMVHHGVQLGEFGDRLATALENARREYRLPLVGASFYSVAEFESAAKVMPLQVVQVPFNVFNQAFDQLFDGGIDRPEVHARSIFLQGVLLAPPAARPRYFDSFGEDFRVYQDTLAETRSSALEFNLSAALSRSWIDRVVVGVTSATELREILAVRSRAITSQQLHRLASSDDRLINPSQWKFA